MAFTNATLFPYNPMPLTNISPLTYRDGITFLEKLEIMREWLNDSLVPEFNAGIEHAIKEMQDAMQVVNNKTGQAEIQRYTLAGPYTLEIDPVWPDNNMVNVVLTQNIVGGHAVTWGTGIDGSGVTVNLLPNEVTDFWLVPDGDGTWTAINYVLGAELIATVETINAALALKANASSLATTNTNVTNLTTTVTTQGVELGKKVPYVSTFAELTAAIVAGGTIHVGNAPIAITQQIEVTSAARIVGGNFVLPLDAGYAAFRVTSSNVTFDGCTFTGAGTGANFAENARFIHAQGTSDSYLKNVNVTGCRMTGNQSDNIRYAFVRDSFIDNNNIDSFLYSGIMLLSVEDSTVSNNTVTNAVMKAPIVNVYGIAATDVTNAVATRSRNVKIIGNTVRNIIWEGIDTHGGEGIIIQGNTVESCGRGIALVVGNSERLTAPLNCVVSGNYVDKGTDIQNDREGISLYGISTNFATAVITGNVVKGYDADKPIYTLNYDSRRTLVEGNSHPHINWTPLTMDNGAEWIAHATYPPQYMIDGRTVYTRGLVTPVGTQTTATTRIGGIPSVGRPGALTFFKQTRGANSLSATSATIAANPDGAIEMYYRSHTADYYSYPIDGSYQRDYLGAL